MKVLTVADRPEAVERLARCLGHNGAFECVLFRTPEELVQRLGQDSSSRLIACDIDSWLDGDRYPACLRRLVPWAPVIALSRDDDPVRILRCVGAGVRGYVVKGDAASRIVDAFRMVAEGHMVLPPLRAAPVAVPGLAKVASQAARNGLTLRQRQVLERMIQGKSNKAIAQELGIRETTVKSHVTAVLDALGVDNRTEAVWVAAGLGVMPPEVGRGPRPW